MRSLSSASCRASLTFCRRAQSHAGAAAAFRAADASTRRCGWPSAGRRPASIRWRLLADGTSSAIPTPCCLTLTLTPNVAAPRRPGSIRTDPAVISILQAPPLLTVQDLGRLEGRIHGIPRPARWMIGRSRREPFSPATQPARRGSNGPSAPAPFASKHRPSLRLQERQSWPGSESGQPHALHRACGNGEVLTIERLTGGRFLYVTFQGGIDVPQRLGSRSTYLPGKFGGFEGRRLKAGDVLPLGIPARSAPTDGFTMPRSYGFATTNGRCA